MVYGYGFEGFREAVQWPDNVFAAYPATKAQSRYLAKDDQVLNSKVKTFLDSHSKVVIVSGSLLETKHQALIADVIEETKGSSLGFIDLSDDPEKFLDIDSSDYLVVNTGTECISCILAHNNTKLSLTLGDPDQLIEKLYFGIPVIIFSDSDE